jgi:hypothetical protein
MGDQIKEVEIQELDDEMKALINGTVIKTRREERNKLLLESDKYVLQDFPITLENKMLILSYRDNLRNFNFNDFYLTLPQFPI